MKFSESNLNEITELGKNAVIELKNSNLNKFEEYAEMGFNIFPENIKNMENNDIKSKFMDLGYRYIKMILKGFLDNKKFEIGEKWLDRLIGFNDAEHLFDEEVNFFCGKFYYETGNFDEAFNKWKDVVNQSGKNHKRYFEGEDPKYLEFYNKQKKLHEK